MRSPRIRMRQRGAVIIVTLWTITLLTILIAALAAQVRLSARAAFFHQEDLQHWANVQSALNLALMELVLERMPPLPRDLRDTIEDPRDPRYRFDGRMQTLELPQAEGVAVRIWDHAGKINLRDLSRPRLRALLEKRLGEDATPQALDALIAAWDDWRDLNELAGINGAESDYYLDLPQPYRARNSNLETVQELLLIRGFAELFADVDLDAAFTLYGEEQQLDLNVASVEAMRLLPGLDDELISEIVAFRAERDFRGNGDIARIVPAENMGQLRGWVRTRPGSNFYTIMIYRQGGDTSENDSAADTGDSATAEEPTHAFAATVQVSDFSSRPRILKINPYQSLPLRPETLLEE